MLLLALLASTAADHRERSAAADAVLGRLWRSRRRRLAGHNSSSQHTRPAAPRAIVGPEARD
jgi:hypothetical protein